MCDESSNGRGGGEEEDVPPVFIPTLGRWGDRAVTSRLLVEYGVPHTLVVEPHEAELYRGGIGAVGRRRRVPVGRSAAAAAVQDGGGGTTVQQQGDDDTASELVSVAVLPLSGQGVSYARRYVYRHLAPRALGSNRNKSDGWFWSLDDDIAAFFVADAVTRSTAAKRRARTADEFLAIPAEVQRDLSIASMALEYERYWLPTPGALAVNSYACVAVALRVFAVPPQLPLYRPLVRVREDYDATLQLMAAGLTTVRRRDVAFRVPSMGAKGGGMTPVYLEQRSVKAANDVFMALWADEESKDGGDSVGPTPWILYASAAPPAAAVAAANEEGGEKNSGGAGAISTEVRRLRVDFHRAADDLTTTASGSARRITRGSTQALLVAIASSAPPAIDSSSSVTPQRGSTAPMSH